MLSKLADCLRANKSTSGSEACAVTIAQFIQQIEKEVLSNRFVSIVDGTLSGVWHDTTALEVLDALSGVLSHLPAEEAMSSYLGGELTPLQGYLICQLVSRAAVPVARLAYLRLRLVGAGASPPPCRWALLSITLKTILQLDQISVQKDWVTSLLDYVLVKPQDTMPLIVLSCLLCGWYSTPFSYLLDDIHTSWTSLRDFFHLVSCSATATDQARLRLDSSFQYSFPLFLSHLSGEEETEIISRLVRILSSISSTTHSVRLLKASILSLLRGSRKGRAVRRGLVPKLQVVVSNHSVELAEAIFALTLT